MCVGWHPGAQADRCNRVPQVRWVGEQVRRCRGEQAQSSAGADGYMGV